ncbi:hypothetical protein GGR57DRAFT_205603 [Xylariaceae sp. FL1272]|nr:hypothetical protein GGR57DRAFT_205603 [Xylariaceae sp. FL1272]
MATSTTPLPGRSTFGFEIEFIVPTLYDNLHDPITHDVPLLRIPRGQLNPQQYVVEQIQNCLDKYLPFPRKPVLYISPPNESPMDRYQGYQAEDDYSLYASPRGPYHYYGVEINSSVEFNYPEAFDVIQYAVSCVTQEFRCFVNNSCGLHVHTGCRDEVLGPDQINRVGSLAYAIEPLLFSLHDPIRTVNPYCPPLQDVSRLAWRMKCCEQEHRHDYACIDLLGLGRRHGEAEIHTRQVLAGKPGQRDFLATREPGRYDPFVKSKYSPSPFTFCPWVSDINNQIDLAVAHCRAANSGIQEPRPPSTRTRTIPSFKTSRLSESELGALRVKIQTAFNDPSRWLDETTGIAANVISSVDEIYSQRSSCAVSWLLESEYSPRLSVAFNSYGCYPLTAHIKRTIEWRLAEPSLDGEWIATWAKICVGLYEFALYASPADIIEVIDKAHLASKGEVSYDVIDLLDDIGLFAEAAVVENRLKAHKERLRVQFVS